MKHYVSREDAEQLLSDGPTIDYPNLDRNLEIYPPVAGHIAEPSPLVAESVHLFSDKGPKLILDVGAAAGVDSIYLAAQGHRVTAIDTNKAILEWANEKAKELGVSPKNFVPRTQNILTLPPDEKYDVVVANMFLHFLPEASVQLAMRTICEATVPGGFNVLSAYTEDNPPEEISLRGLQYLFKSGLMSSFYSSGQWVKLRDEEGMSPKIVNRSAYLGHEGTTYLLPTIAEVVAQKRTHGSIPSGDLDRHGDLC